MERKMLEQRLAADITDHGIATLGSNLFIGQLPEDVETGIFMVPTASPEPHLYLPNEEHIIDFWCRSDYTDKAFSLLTQIFELYHQRANYQLGDWYIYFSNATGTIMDMDRDREGGKLLKLGVSFLCRNITNVS